MTKSLNDDLQNLFIETLDRTGRLCPLPPDVPAPEPSPVRRAACVRFSGPWQGTLSVRLDQTLLKRLSQNFLGEDSPCGPEEEEDVIKELANIVCGNVLPFIAGPEALFQVTPPETVKTSEAAEMGREWPLVAECRLGYPEGLVEAWVWGARSGAG